jgi:uncharacterized membrane protein YpjA
MILKLWLDFYQNPTKPVYLKLLLIINLPGSLAGFLWYKYHLSVTPWYYWPFVPDSPLSSALFTLVLFLLLINRAHPLIQLVAYTAVVKYGLWAIFVLSGQWLTGGDMRAIEVALWLSHLGMAVEGMIFWRRLVYRQVYGVITWAWMYFNDLMDYYVGLHPYLQNYDHWLIVMIFTLMLSTLLGTAAKARGQKVTRLQGY